jgi:hypothetical protein
MSLTNIIVLLYTHLEFHPLLLKFWFHLCHLAVDLFSPVLPIE